MKRKAYKRTRNRARRHFEKWTYLLGLGWWDVEVHWYDSGKAFRKASGDHRYASSGDRIAVA